MATPRPNDYMAALYDFGGLTVRDHIREHFINPTILDIGAGWGKYAILLPECTMDAVEIWQPYVDENKLDKLYRDVFVKDIRKFKTKRYYDAIIMGDVFEHLPRSDMKKLLPYLLNRCGQLYVVTPFEMEQGPVDGNPHEEHKQADLSEKVMTRHYPQLKLLAKKQENDYIKAVYVKKETE